MPNGPILLVDDEPINIDALREALGSTHRLLVACNGTDALALARKHRPSLVILDVEMPVIDGYATCKALKEDPATAHIPVIFVTGRANVADEARGFDCGAVDYIHKPFSPPLVRARVDLHLSLVRASQLQRSYRDAITMLGSAGHFNDNDTGMHIWRMAAYAREIASGLGWSAEDSRQLELAAPMHDTGKLGIPGNILRKPGQLDAAEWKIMRTHPQIGFSILSKSSAPVFQLAAEISLWHHEKWNGSGYPNAARGEAIPLSARIVAVADVFDALTMRRPYKEEWPVEKALSALQEGAGTHFDPHVVEVFEECLPRIVQIKNDWNARESTQLSALSMRAA